MFEFAPYPDFRSASTDVLKYLRSRLGFGLWMVTRTENDAWIVLQSLDPESGVRDGDVFRWAGSTAGRGRLALSRTLHRKPPTRWFATPHATASH